MHLAFAAVLALPIAAAANMHGHAARNHHELAKKATNQTVEERSEIGKRFTANRLTFYDVGLGACGKTNVASDPIVALNAPQYGSGSPGPQCFKWITIHANGKSLPAQIMDECPECAYGALDLSRGLFSQFADFGAGVIQGTWEFQDGSGGGTVSSSSSSKPPPSSTWSSSTSKWTPSSSSTSTSSTSSSTSTSSTSSSTSHSTSTSSSKKATTTSSSSTDYAKGGIAVPTGTAGSYSNQNLFQINEAVVNVGNMIAMGNAL